MSRNFVPQSPFFVFSVTSRKGRVSRNKKARKQAVTGEVTSRKGRVSRNKKINGASLVTESRPVRGV